MSCEMFERWVVSDEAEERLQAERHAADCPDCAAVLADHRRLADEAEAWREAFEAPAGLEQRVRRAVTRVAEAAKVVPIDRGDLLAPPAAERTSGRRGVVYLGLAASLIIGLIIGWQPFRPAPAPESADRLLAAEALAAADEADRTHARAIARLESAVSPILARATDPATDAARAARLLAYADRLAFLDATIADIGAFVESNPGYSEARTTLLAAYREKTDILREVLALEEAS